MDRDLDPGRREDACRRAESHSPFLRDALSAHPEIGEAFLADGPDAAAALALSLSADDVEAELRRRRRALALAVGLGDLAGELSLESATRLLSDFADRSIDTALTTAILERSPGAEPGGFAVIAMGKLGSHELN